MKSTEDFGLTGPSDDELFDGLHRSVAGATMTASAADVVALGRRARTRHRAVAAGVGTSMAALVAAIGVLAPSADSGPGTASARGLATATGKRLAPGQTLDIQEAGFSLSSKGDGKVTLSVSEVFDAAKIQAALASIGISSRVERITASEGSGIIVPTCEPKTGRQFADDDFRNYEGLSPGTGARAMTIDAAHIPAGEVLVVRLTSLKQGVITAWSLYKRDPGPCIPANKSVKVQ
ncbi:MAG: hypothetical protein HOV87_30640 [Catenulispora sp.]|nr:hypothetical protein [Catenulispora sp.]